MTPSGTGGVVNDAVAIYFADATLASAFVARWCVAQKVDTVNGVFRCGFGMTSRHPASGRLTTRRHEEDQAEHPRGSTSIMLGAEDAAGPVVRRQYAIGGFGDGTPCLR
jgi:hypothetical protein